MPLALQDHTSPRLSRLHRSSGIGDEGAGARGGAPPPRLLLEDPAGETPGARRGGRYRVAAAGHTHSGADEDSPRQVRWSDGPSTTTCADRWAGPRRLKRTSTGQVKRSTPRGGPDSPDLGILLLLEAMEQSEAEDGSMDTLHLGEAARSAAAAAAAGAPPVGGRCQETERLALCAGPGAVRGPTGRPRATRTRIPRAAAAPTGAARCAGQQQQPLPIGAAGCTASTRTAPTWPSHRARSGAAVPSCRAPAATVAAAPRPSGARAPPASPSCEQRGVSPLYPPAHRPTGHLPFPPSLCTCSCNACGTRFLRTKSLGRAADRAMAGIRRDTAADEVMDGGAGGPRCPFCRCRADECPEMRQRTAAAAAGGAGSPLASLPAAPLEGTKKAAHPKTEGKPLTGYRARQHQAAQQAQHRAATLAAKKEEEEEDVAMLAPVEAAGSDSSLDLDLVHAKATGGAAPAPLAAAAAAAAVAAGLHPLLDIRRQPLPVAPLLPGGWAPLLPLPPSAEPPRNGYTSGQLETLR